MWSFPPGWSGKFSTSKQRWYYWKINDPENTVTWHPPSWNKESLQLQLVTKGPFYSCQKFCEKALLDTWLKPTDHILEIGCGKGENSRLVTCTYKGIDTIKTNKKNLKKADFTLEKYLCDQLKETFSFAFSFNAVHNAGECLDTAFKSIASILKNHGQFLFTVLDASLLDRHPEGFGPIKIQKWEKNDQHQRIWIHNQPENILSVKEVQEACRSAHLTIHKTELCGTALLPLSDFAESLEQHQLRDQLNKLKASFDDSWDSLHWEYVNCFRVYLVEKII